MDKYSVKLMSRAVRDLDDIYDYIAGSLLEPETATKLIDRMEQQIYLESENKDMQTGKEREPAAIYGEQVAALQAQVKKQEQIINIINTQEETVRILTEHNEEL